MQDNKKGNDMAVKNILKISRKNTKPTASESARGIQLKEKITDYCKQTDTDMLLFNGTIGDSVGFASGFVDFILNRPHKKNCMLFLTTYGGDANWAYKIYRALKTTYDNYDVIICGFCKSAGTLITLGARKLFFSNIGEIGPLDVQMSKKDDFFKNQSALDMFRSQELIRKWSSDFFKNFFFELLQSTGGTMSVPVMSDAVNKMAGNLFTPIMDKINPIEVGETWRAMNIANIYGNIMKSSNVNSDTIRMLIYDYPSHSFVIDIKQATELFANVYPLDDVQNIIYNSNLKKLLEQPQQNGAFGDVLQFISDCS